MSMESMPQTIGIKFRHGLDFENVLKTEAVKELFYSPVEREHIKKERKKARELQASQWWRQKLQTGVCHYCELKYSPSELTMDHIVPVGRGGRSNPGNLVVCCKTCNSKKAHKTPAEMMMEALL
jgi:5-methylcytosine-specific restriction enzyme A